MAYTTTEANKVLKNQMTKQLIEWVDSQKRITKILLSPQFFHQSHSKRDREVIVEMIENFYPGCKVKRSSKDAVVIEF
jgi:hypothetical protein